MGTRTDRVGAARESLFVGLLGPLTVWRDGSPVELGTPQQRKLLAVLVLRRNDMVSTDHIVDALWGDIPPPQALQVVRTYVSRLRRALSPEAESPLVTEHRGYRLVLDEEQTDVGRFEALAVAGRTALQAGDAIGAVSQLEEARSLVRGQPLGDLLYDDLARYEIDRLEELQQLVEEDLMEARLAQGRHRELIPKLRALTEQHPLRERIWAQLMLALYRSGRQAEALTAFHEARRFLADELGLNPGPELRGLERKILLQDRTLDHDAVGRMHGVPRYVTSLVGRGPEVEAVRSLTGRARLVSLVGPAGSGKTRLAAEAALGVRLSFRDGIWWVDLGAVGQGQVAAAFAERLALREDARSELPDLVVSRLHEASSLLVIDNCEHVAAEVTDLVARILADTKSVRILATSREPLRIPAEHVYRVPPLSVPPDSSIGPDRIMEFEAPRLLVARVTAAAGSVTLDEETAAAVAKIVTRVDGLPLAIELAAGKARAMSLAELARALDERIGLLAGGTTSGPRRQRTLEASIAWGFELVTPEERTMLVRLSVFAGSFDESAAEAVGAASDAERRTCVVRLAQLVDRSLLTAELGDPTRYRLLETVRAFALERARRAGELDPSRQRHLEHHVVLGEQVFRHMLDSELGVWLGRARLDHDNLRAALRWALAQGDGDVALQLASALAAYWIRTSHLREGRELLEHALVLAGPVSPWRPRGLVGKAWLSLNAAAPDALEVARDAVEACEVADDELRGFAQAALAQAEIARAELDHAEHAVARARRAFAGIGHEEGLHLSDELMGLVRFGHGDLEGALTDLIRSRDLYRELRGNLDAGWTLVHLARVQLTSSLNAEAHAAATDAVEDFRARGDPRGLVAAFTCLGRAHAALGDPDEALLFLDEALELGRRLDYAAELAEAEVARATLRARETAAP